MTTTPSSSFVLAAAMAAPSFFCAVGCGGAKPEPSKEPIAAGSSAATPAPAPAPSASSPSSAPSTRSSAAPGEDEETSEATKKAIADATRGTGTVAPYSGSTIALENLLGKPGSEGGKSFPKATTTDAACIGDVGLSLEHAKDYDELSAKCGTGAGLVPFTKKVTGEFSPAHSRDVYDFKMLGGYCYRFFGTGDSTIKDLNILVQRPNGSLVSLDQSKQPVAVLDPDRVWCKTHDREFHVVVETRGGAGKYMFGIWARPKH